MEMQMTVLRRERLRRKWTLENIETITGISVATLSRLERGLTPCRRKWMAKLELLFGLSITELLRKFPLSPKPPKLLLKKIV